MKTRTIIKDQNGATAVEFALILPLLVLLLFGIIEFGLILYNKQIITNAAREGARYGVVVRLDRYTNDQIKAKIREYASEYLISFGSDELEDDDIDILPIDIDDSFDPTVDPPVERCTFFGCDLKIEVTYDYDFLFGFGQKTLEAESIMRME